MKLRYALLTSEPKAKENEKLAEEGKPTGENVFYSGLRAVEGESSRHGRGGT